MSDYKPQAEGRWISKAEFFAIENAARERAQELELYRQSLDVYSPPTQPQSRKWGRKAIYVVALVAAGIFAINKFAPDVNAKQAINNDSSSGDKTAAQTDGEKSFTTSPEAFLPEPFCLQVVDINVQKSFIPVSWKTDIATFSDNDDFPAVIEGQATVDTCLSDIAAVQYDRNESEKSKSAIWRYDLSNFDTSIKDDDLLTYIASMTPEELLPILQEQLDNPSIGLVDAQSVIGQINGHEGEIDARSRALIVNAILMREVPILSITDDGVAERLENQAAEQGINPNRIDFLPVESLDGSTTDLGFEPIDAPPDKTGYFDYKSDEAHPQIIVVAHQE